MTKPARGAGLALAVFLAILSLPASSRAATAKVEARDNFFVPNQLRVEVGDKVEWRNAGARAHTITSDTGVFNSGRLEQGAEFAFTFKKEGYFFYHCRLHGSEKSGMWGVVTVGDPPRVARRTKIHVPRDHKTIQRAVNKALPGSTIVIAPGTYREDIVVRTPDLILKGADRFRTVIHGGDALDSGITIAGADDVIVKNLTVRNFLVSGIHVHDTTGFTVARVDAIKNRTYGVNAVSSFDGSVRRSFVWGSGDSGVRVADCHMCSVIVRKVQASHNYLGVAIRNASGVVVKDSLLRRNGTGVGAFTVGASDEVRAHTLTLVRNQVTKNDYATIPAAGFSQSFGLPFGTGIWMAGTATTFARENLVLENGRYGILVTESIDGAVPSRWNDVTFNTVRRSGFDLAWDGIGVDTCFSDNDFIGSTGPADIESLYPCGSRPFAGEPFEPVIEDIAAALADTERDQSEPPEPRRPRCQKGKPGCGR